MSGTVASLQRNAEFSISNSSVYEFLLEAVEDNSKRIKFMHAQVEVITKIPTGHEIKNLVQMAGRVVCGNEQVGALMPD
jgi:hypothetical protein